MPIVTLPGLYAVSVKLYVYAQPLLRGRRFTKPKVEPICDAPEALLLHPPWIVISYMSSNDSVSIKTSVGLDLRSYGSFWLPRKAKPCSTPEKSCT